MQTESVEQRNNRFDFLQTAKVNFITGCNLAVRECHVLEDIEASAEAGRETKGQEKLGALVPRALIAHCSCGHRIVEKLSVGLYFRKDFFFSTPAPPLSTLETYPNPQ